MNINRTHWIYCALFIVLLNSKAGFAETKCREALGPGHAPCLTVNIPLTVPSLFCPEKVESTQMAPLLQGVENVNLHVKFSFPHTDYQDAITCHPHPETCPHPGFASQEYEYYPKALLPDSLTSLFAAEIGNDLAAAVAKDGKCVKTTVRVINNAPQGHCIDVTTPAEAISCARKTISDLTGEKNSLTISVTSSLRNIKNVNDPDAQYAYPNKGTTGDYVVVLTWELFRPGCQHAYGAANGVYEVVIPLNYNEEQVTMQLNKLMQAGSWYLHMLQTWPNARGDYKCATQ